MGNLRNKANKLFAFNKTVAITRRGGRKISLAAISREFGKSVDWLLPGEEKK